MIKGTYVGSDERLRGKTALLRSGNGLREYMAQFDDMRLVIQKDSTDIHLGFGWHSFPMKDWETIPSEDDPGELPVTSDDD